MKKGRSVIIVGALSSIGQALSREWAENGWQVYGTYYKNKKQSEKFKDSKTSLVYCDLSNDLSVESACLELKKLCPVWDALVLCPASLEPIGLFGDVNIDHWKNSVELNFVNQIKIVHLLLPSRRKDVSLGPCVIFFSGGGINEVTTNYSAYTISKIATIKMAEILDMEVPDTRFVSLGPGWVDTKIHKQTIKAGSKAGQNYERTIKKIKSNDFTPMNLIIECCNWIINSPKKVISGRNINIVYDDWRNSRFSKQLIKDHNLLKLRKNIL